MYSLSPTKAFVNHKPGGTNLKPFQTPLVIVFLKVGLFVYKRKGFAPVFWNFNKV